MVRARPPTPELEFARWIVWEDAHLLAVDKPAGVLSQGGEGGEGDLGYCARVCDCDDDCGRADAVCEPQGSVAEETGRQGVCASAVFASGAMRSNFPCN